MKPVFKTVLIYENFAAGVRARWFCARLVRALDSTLEEQMWNFDVLGIRDVRNAAAGAARKADIVIVSVTTIAACFNLPACRIDEILTQTVGLPPK